MDVDPRDERIRVPLDVGLRRDGEAAEIARITGGRYFPATLQGREVDGIREVLDGLEKGDLGEAYRRRVEERFQVPAGIALVMLALALLTPEARRPEETA